MTAFSAYCATCIGKQYEVQFGQHEGDNKIAPTGRRAVCIAQLDVPREHEQPC